MTRQRRATSADVARMAGVSRTTVSYVLNDQQRDRIPEPTRRRVLDAARTLNYEPSAAARLLRGGNSRVVLMISPALGAAQDRIGADIIRRIGVALGEHQIQMVWQLGVESNGDGTTVDVTPCVVLAASTERDALFRELQRRFDAPVLPAFPGLEGFIAGAAVTQAGYVHARGHTTIAYAAPEAADLTPSSQVRLEALSATASALGLEPPETITIPRDRRRATGALASFIASTKATVMCCYNDEVATVVLAAAHDLKIAVPERLAVIGVDGDDYGEFLTPALTTVIADTSSFVTDMAAMVAAIANSTEPATIPSLPRRSEVLERRSC